MERVILLALMLAGCSPFTPLPPVEHVARPGEVMFQVVKAESLPRSYGVGPTVDRTRATATATYTLTRVTGTVVQVTRERVGFRSQVRTGSVWVSVPGDFPNAYRSEPGTSKSVGSSTYSRAAMTGERRAESVAAVRRESQPLVMYLDASGRGRAVWEGHGIVFLGNGPMGLRYRIDPPRISKP